jgi:DNA-binding LytR/AlgR family response regulator
MRYAIVENEELALLNMRRSVEELRPDYLLVFTAESVEDTITQLQAHTQLDLIFMDIELTDGNCFQIFQQVKVSTPIIFTTAYDDYAIQAFKVNSIDYLLKPISDRELQRAIEKFEMLHTPAAVVPDYARLVDCFRNITPTPHPLRDRILIKVGDNYSNVGMNDIAYFLRDDKYVTAVLTNGKRRITDFQNLNEVEQCVDPYRFFQLSRNIITNITAISKVSKWFKGRLNVTISAGDDHETVVVSAARKDDFLDWYGGKR